MGLDFAFGFQTQIQTSNPKKTINNFFGFFKIKNQFFKVFIKLKY